MAAITSASASASNACFQGLHSLLTLLYIYAILRLVNTPFLKAVRAECERKLSAKSRQASLEVSNILKDETKPVVEGQRKYSFNCSFKAL